MVGGIVGKYKNAVHFDVQAVFLDTLLVERLILFHLYQCNLLDISNPLKEKPIYNLVIHHIRHIYYIYLFLVCLMIHREICNRHVSLQLFVYLFVLYFTTPYMKDRICRTIKVIALA